MKSAHSPPVSRLPSDPLLQFLGHPAGVGKGAVAGGEVEEQVGSRTRVGEVTAQRASPLVAPASQRRWLTLLGVCFLEPGLPKCHHPCDSGATRRRTRPRGTWVPEVLTLLLGPRPHPKPEDCEDHTALLNPKGQIALSSARGYSGF